MKKFIFILFLAMTSQGHAAIYDVSSPGTFGYGGFSWTTGFSPSDNNNGLVLTEGDAFGDVQIVGSDTGNFVDPIAMGTTNITTDIVESGTISFVWDYFTDDDSTFDPFAWLTHDTGPTRITADNVTGGQTGTFSQHVDVGTFSLAILSDNLFGGGAWTGDVGLTAFSFTADIAGNPVPVPPAFLLFGTALAGLSYFRKKKSAAAV